MNLFKNLRRFEVKKLFVCRIYTADNLHYEPYRGKLSKYYTIYTPRFLSIKILYGDKILVDPVYGIKYIPSGDIDSLNPDKNIYYENLGNIIDILGEDLVDRKTKISLAKIKELNAEISNILSSMNSNKN